MTKGGYKIGIYLDVQAGNHHIPCRSYYWQVFTFNTLFHINHLT